MWRSWSSGAAASLPAGARKEPGGHHWTGRLHALHQGRPYRIAPGRLGLGVRTHQSFRADNAIEILLREGLAIVSRNLFWLTDEQWGQIEPYLPSDVRGKERVDDRRLNTPSAGSGDRGLGSTVGRLSL